MCEIGMNSSVLKLLQNTKAELKSTLESRNLHFRIYIAENKIKDLEHMESSPRIQKKSQRC